MINPINPTKTHSPIKKAAKVAATVGVAAAATGSVLYLASKGKLNPTEGGNKYVEVLKGALKKPADFILKKGKEFADFVALESKGNPKVSAIVDRLAMAKEKVSVLSETVKGKLETFVKAHKSM